MEVGLPGLQLQTLASAGAKLPGGGIKVERRGGPHWLGQSLRRKGPWKFSELEKAGEIETKETFAFLEHNPAAARLIWIPQRPKSNSIPTGC
jgi:hypothetical protein